MPSPLVTAVSTLAGAALDLAFPPSCSVCRRSMAERTSSNDELCLDCEQDLVQFDEAVCPRCSTPVQEVTSADCPICREERWAFDGVVALGPYAGLLRRMVLEGKRAAGEPGLITLGRRLAERVEIAADTVVTPVPAHWTRRLGRRADGVEALAKALASAAGVSFQKTLRRRRATPRQTEVAPSARAANVRRAFAVKVPQKLAGKPILLIDDVFTTGSTCNAAARALKQAGAARVVAVVAARRLGSL